MSDPVPLPRLPDAADREPPPSDEARNFATLLALVALLGVAGGLLFLVALVLPGALMALLAVLLIPLYFAFHYVVWGRLMRMPADDADAPATDE